MGPSIGEKPVVTLMASLLNAAGDVQRYADGVRCFV